MARTVPSGALSGHSEAFDEYFHRADGGAVRTPYQTAFANGYIESFNGKLRDELLDGEFCLPIDKVRYVVDRWRMDYNHYQPHSSLGCVSPVAFAASCGSGGSASPHLPRHTYLSVDTLIKGGT